MSKTAIALGLVFATVAGAAGYEAYKLNDLVWSAPEVGDVKLWRRGDIADVTLTLERKESLWQREEFTTKLNVMFAENSAEPTQVCVDTGYEVAGIFQMNPQSELLQKYIAQNPVFREFITEEANRYNGKTEFNNYVTFATHNLCHQLAGDLYPAELNSAIEARKNYLGL